MPGKLLGFQITVSCSYCMYKSNAILHVGVTLNICLDLLELVSIIKLTV